MLNSCRFRSNLIQHRAVHKRPYICSICHKRFDKEDQLRKHLLAHPEAMLTCTLCKYAATDQSDLNRHIMDSHAAVLQEGLRRSGTEILRSAAVAANIVRRVLVDATRAKTRQKRGGGAAAVTFDEQLQPGDGAGTDLLALDEALDRLAQLDERKAKVIELHYFGGLSQPEVGEALGISVATVERDLKTARAFLHRELSAPES